VSRKLLAIQFFGQLFGHFSVRASSLVPLLINVVVFFLVLGNAVAAILSESFGLSARQINILFKAIVSTTSILLIMIAFRKRTISLYEPLLAFLAIFFISTLYLTFVHAQGEPHFSPGIEYVLAAGIGSVVLPFCAIVLSFKEIGKAGNWLFLWLLFTCLMIAVLGDVYSLDANQSVYVDTGRLHLPSFNPISVSMLGGFLVLLSVFRLTQGTSNKVFNLLAGTLGLYVLVSGASRSTTIGLIFALLCMSFARKPKLTLLLSPVGLALSIYSTTFIGSRFTDILDPSISGRILIYKIYYYSIVDNFVFPVIPLEYSLLWAHNIILGVYSSSTVFGLILFFYLLSKCFRASFRLIAQDLNNGWIGMFFIFIFTISFFSGALIDIYFWVISALVIAYAGQKRAVTAGL
jgi:O-antigen ligase